MAHHFYLPQLTEENIPVPKEHGHWNNNERKIILGISDAITIDEFGMLMSFIRLVNQPPDSRRKVDRVVDLCAGVGVLLGEGGRIQTRATEGCDKKRSEESQS